MSASYTYYKDKITNILPTELNDITEEWKGAYDQVYNDINSNKDNFKSSVFEIYYISLFYIQAYTQNISYGYGKSIVEKLKNDFNYTNKYYYNLIISKLNKTYAYILNNLPTNEKPFDKILNIFNIIYIFKLVLKIFNNKFHWIVLLFTPCEVIVCSNYLLSSLSDCMFCVAS